MWYYTLPAGTCRRTYLYIARKAIMEIQNIGISTFIHFNLIQSIQYFFFHCVFFDYVSEYKYARNSK
jgi:hypothetical protein